MLWELVRGLMNSMNMIITTCILMFFILYIYACVGLELMTKEKDSYESDAQLIIEYQFSSVRHFMISLVQFSTFDSAAPIYIPLIYENWVMLPYFMSFMLVVGIQSCTYDLGVVVGLWEYQQTSNGSFSAASKPTFASTHFSMSSNIAHFCTAPNSKCLQDFVNLFGSSFS